MVSTLATACAAENDYINVGYSQRYPSGYNMGVVQEAMPKKKKFHRIFGSTPHAKAGVEITSMENMACMSGKGLRR